MPWGAVVGGVIGAAGSALSKPDDPEQAPQSMLQGWQGHLAPQYVQHAANMGTTPFQGYGMQRNEGFNPAQQFAMQGIANRSLGSGVEQAGQGAMMRAASGNANPMFGMDNPYTTKAIDATTSDMQRQFNKTTAPMLDAMNSRANTGFGTSSAVDEMRTDAYQGLNDQMAQVSNDMRYKDLNAQQHMGEGMAARQLQAAGLSPAMQALDYNNLNAHLGIGNQQQALGQSNRDFNFAEFMRQQGHPQTQLNAMNQVMGMSSVAPQMQFGQQQPNYFNSALGGAAAGMGIYNQFRTPQQQNPYAMPTTVDGNMYNSQPSQWWGGDGQGW